MSCNGCSYGGTELEDWLSLPKGNASLDACWNAVVANPSCINRFFEYKADGVSVTPSCICRLHEDSRETSKIAYAIHAAGK